MIPIVESLLRSKEPAIQYKVRVQVLGEDPDSRAIKKLRNEIRRCPRVRKLLSNRRTDGRIEPLRQVYRKWWGAHWVVASLADIGYPAGDKKLQSAIDQLMDCWASPEALREFACDRLDRPIWGVPIINGRARRCASQQSNALFSAVALGFMDERTDRLARSLVQWQWPDGGWNCDRRPEACHSSFWESIIPLRALSAYARATGDRKARAAAKRAAELFLSHRLYLRKRDGEVMNPEFTQLHYPRYWRYDILWGLKVMAEAGFIKDPRCANALDLLESKRLPDGGWPAEARFYKNADGKSSNADLVDWGPTEKKKMNEWITADALVVLKAAGRL